MFDYFLASALKSPTISALNKRLTALGEPFIFGIRRVRWVDGAGRGSLVCLVVSRWSGRPEHLR